MINLNWKIGSAIIGAVMALGGAVSAGTITPDIIFGSGNSNRGFTVSTVGSLELGLRAKLRYGPSGPNDAIGNGIIQNVAGDYLFDSNISTAPSNRAMWNFDWTINSNVDGNGGELNSLNYLLSVDMNPSVGISTLDYAPLIAPAYYGTNATPNGGAMESIFYVPGSNVAQQSVNYGFIPSAPLGDGFFNITLSAFDGSQLVGSTSINVIVAPSPVPLPAGLPLLATAFGGLAWMRRRRKA